MSSQLTDTHLTDPVESKRALDIAALEEPLENPHLRRIWRHAFLLACAGFDHFVYQTSHTNSTMWQIGHSTARVFDAHFVIEDNSGLAYEVAFRTIDNIRIARWSQDHGGEPAHRDFHRLVEL